MEISPLGRKLNTVILAFAIICGLYNCKQGVINQVYFGQVFSCNNGEKIVKSVKSEMQCVHFCLQHGSCGILNYIERNEDKKKEQICEVFAALGANSDCVLVDYGSASKAMALERFEENNQAIQHQTLPEATGVSATNTNITLPMTSQSSVISSQFSASGLQSCASPSWPSVSPSTISSSHFALETISAGSQADINMIVSTLAHSLSTNDKQTFEAITSTPSSTTQILLESSYTSVYRSCKEIYEAGDSTLQSKSYHLESGSHYCAMGSLGECGAGGWTLAMAIDGSMINEYDHIDWTMKLMKSYEMKELSLKEPVFNFTVKSPRTGFRSIKRVQRLRSNAQDININSNASCTRETTKTLGNTEEEARGSSGSSNDTALDKSTLGCNDTFANSEVKVKTSVAVTTSSLLGKQKSTGAEPVIRTSASVTPPLSGEQICSAEAKPVASTSSAVGPQIDMDVTHDKPSDGVREFHQPVDDGRSRVYEMATLYDVHPIRSSSNSNLGLYEEDVQESLVSLLSRHIGLSYLRNPYDVDDLSVALPTDTLVGVWDNFEGFIKASRIVPHGKGTLSTTDDRVIYVGDFRNGKRCGYGTALIVERWTDPYHGIGCYQGHWVDNCRHGFGCLELVSGLRYNGEWYLDKPQGKGLLIYPDGSILKGYFAGGLHEGTFTYYSAGQYVDFLDFKGGSLVKSRPLQMVDHRTGSPPSGVKKTDDTVLLPQAESKPSRNNRSKQFKSLKSLSVTTSKSEVAPKEDAIAYEDTSCRTKVEPPVVTNEENLRQNDVDLISGEIDLDDLLERLVSIMQVENEFFVKHQMSKVKMYCEDLLSTAQEELCKISDKYTKNIADLDVVISTRSKLNDVQSEMDKLTAKFDGVLDLCKSILDGQEKIDSRISALDVHVAEMNEMKERETVEKLKEDLRKKQTELSTAESSLICLVCQDNRRDCVLMPCMHMQTCSICVTEIRRRPKPAECPICRTAIQGEVRVKPN